MDNHIRVDKREIDLALSNENIVENGFSRALVSKVLILIEINTHIILMFSRSSN